MAGTPSAFMQEIDEARAELAFTRSPVGTTQATMAVAITNPLAIRLDYLPNSNTFLAYF